MRHNWVSNWPSSRFSSDLGLSPYLLPLVLKVSLWEGEARNESVQEGLDFSSYFGLSPHAQGGQGMVVAQQPLEFPVGHRAGQRPEGEPGLTLAS